MNYPLDLSFKILALASQVYVRDSSGNLLCYVKQKMFKLKEDINIFGDENQTRLLFNIKANKMLDFSATYTFTDAQGKPVGGIRRQGMKSLWKAAYEVLDGNNNVVYNISEENAWVKVIDGVVGEIPVVGMFTGYFFNPAYIASKTDGTPLMKLKKQPAFLEGKFRLEPLGQVNTQDETILLLAFMTMTLLERARG